MNALLPILYTLLCAFCIVRLPFFRSMQLSKWTLLGVFALKITAALALHAIYTYYYPVRADADVFKYFDDAQALFASLLENPLHFLQILFDNNAGNLPHLQPYFENTWHWSRPVEMGLFNDNQTIIRINMLMMLFSWGNIFVHHVLAAFISLVAFCLLYKVFISYFPQQKIIIVLGIFLVPSSLFWASAMLKECIVMLGLGLFLYGLHLFSQRQHWRSALLFLCGFLILLNIKVYILAALLPASIAFAFASKFPRKIKIWEMYAAIFGGAIVFVAVSGIPVLEALVNKRTLFIAQAIEQQAGSYIAIGNIDNNVWAFIKETPAALWRAFALPYIWNIRSVMDVLPAGESFLTIVLIVLACIFPQKITAAQRNLLFFSITFSLALLWFTGITSPTVGGIVRYRMPMLPFLITGIALCVDWKRVKIF
ncbi:MAG: hypothetical protein FWC39_00035 [Bacteroidetes bacterium]|nr:hypothetical protein [Bacteroidota bacterium]